MIKDNDFVLDKSGRVLGYVFRDEILTPEGSEPLDPDRVSFLLRFSPDGGTIIDKVEESGVVFPETEYGSTGLTVVLLQTALKCRGYYTGAIDGDFGHMTHGALYRFMTDEGISGDTVATNEVYQKLFEE